MSRQYDEIHALVDGHLEGKEKAEAMSLVQSDPAARAEHDWAHLVKETLQTKCPKHENAELFSRAMAQVRDIEKSRQTESFVGRYAWAAACIVVATIFMAAIFNRIGGRSEMTQTNVASLFGGGLIPIPGGENDPESALKSSLGRVRFDLQPRIIQVREVAQGLIEGKRAVRMRAMDAEGQLVLFVIEGVDGFEGHNPIGGGFSKGVVNGANGVSWTADGIGFLLVGARDHARLAEVAQAIVGR